MYCTHCGTERAGDASVCPSCGRPIQHFSAPLTIKSYLVESILVTLCCCPPLGIGAIIYAAQVNSRLALGDGAGAEAASHKARKWALTAFILGIIGNAASTAFMFWSMEH